MILQEKLKGIYETWPDDEQRKAMIHLLKAAIQLEKNNLINSCIETEKAGRCLDKMVDALTS